MFFKKFLIVTNLFLVVALKPFAQVSLQTGSGVFSLPMFNWQDDKSRLNTVVGLNYSSGNGLRVNDVASNVGQGWNLVAGGVITRMQVGEPDDQKAYPSNGGSDQDVTKYPAGSLYHSVRSDTGCPKTLTTYPIYGAQNVLYSQKQLTAEDKQLDYFSFQFNGKSGMFILDTTRGDHGIPIGNTKLKISFQRDPTMINSGIRTTITSFTITDVDGLIYKFRRHGLTKLLGSHFSTSDGLIKTTQPTIKSNGVYCQAAFDEGPSAYPWVNQYMANPFIISNWYLDEIDDPFTTRKITFTYNTLNENVPAGQDISYNESAKNYVVISYKKSLTTTLELNSIICQDGHTVTFTYATAPRADYPGEHALSNVSVMYQGRYLSQYQLGTSYFILSRYGTPSTADEIRVARLCLRSVKKIGVDLKEDSPPYIFDYYTGSGTADDIIPPPFFYAKDIWGYYNGDNSKASNGASIALNQSGPYPLGFSALKGLCFRIDNSSATNYNAKANYAQNGLLKEIIFPTGGSLTYQYAQNSGSFIGDATVRNVGGVHVSQTSSSDGGYSNGCGTPVVTKYNYVMNGTGSASSLWGLETADNSIVSNNSWSEEKSTIHFSWSHPLGTCLWHYVYPGILSQDQAVSLEGFQKFMAAIAPVLGVLSIISTITDIVNVIACTGVGAIVAVILDVITAVLGYILGCSKQSKYTTNTVYYNFDLNQMAPLPAQFKRVEVTESSGTNGKTVQLFTHGDQAAASDPQYYALWFPGANNALSSKQRFAPWAYGLPYLTSVYDATGNKIKETENVYDFNYAQWTIREPNPGGTSSCGGKLTYPTYPTSCKCQVINNFSLRSDQWTTAVPTYATSSTADINVDIYSYYTGRAMLYKTYERTYRVADAANFVQTETDYSYNYADCDIATNYSNQGNFEVNTITTIQSNGDEIIKNIKYTTDINSGILSTMVQKNMVSIPVSTSTEIYKSGGGAQYLNEKVTEFTQLSNGDVKPSRILEQRFTTPSTSFTAYSGPSTTNYSLYKIPQVFAYDANSNLISAKDEGSRSIANIFDYNDKYVVASVINADPVADKPAYTSFETSVLGGWTLTGAVAYSPSSFITGAQGFVLTSKTLSAPLNVAKPYIVSFWASNSGVVVTGGATLSKTGPTYLGMTYYEYNIAQGTSSVSLTGTSNIDELRLYPSTSRMRTTTYDALIGKTSECDENNRITYYTYDNLARLQFIKDETGNVVKAYEYNNVSASKQTGCPASYSNHLISELFPRSNCSAGYRGSSVTYTVAAGTYTSLVSQYDADIKAQLNLLTNGQTYANANGSCSLIYYNTLRSQTDTTQSCAAGFKGGLVTYTVPARTYSSIISQADADQLAIDEISANAQSYANIPGNMVCSVDTAADWEWFPGDGQTPADPSYCSSVNGQLPAHLFVLAKDVNPGSPSYNQTRYYDYGPSASCPSNTWYNAQQSQLYTRNNCTGGQAGTSVTYTVPAGKYSSTVSQAAADQLATNDKNANGQNYANTHGICCSQTFTYSSLISSYVVNTIYLSGSSTVNFTFVFAYPPGYTSFTLGTINGSCLFPTSARTIPFSQGSTLFNVIINSNGTVQLQIVSGPTPSGNIGFSSSYDINANAFYSAAKSGTFTRNNCSAGQTGSSVTYNVAPYRYSSLTSQAAADQLAQNDVNNNGQNNANSIGTCSTNCTFTWGSGINGANSTVTSSGTTGTLSITFFPTANGYTGGTVGTIVGPCKPSFSTTSYIVDQATPSRTWRVTVDPSGSVSVSLYSGSSATTSPPPIVINNVTYNL